MNDHEFYKRIAGLLQPGQLRAKRVAVIGLGSGGSRVAAELGRLGVNLLLIERPGERLEEHNIVRHVLGYRSLGKLKLREMVRHIRNLNPSAGIDTCALDVVSRKKALARLLAQWRPDLIAVCTDNEQSKHTVNQTALGLGIPQVGAGVYDGGIGGEVYRVQPGTACYGCIAEHLHLERYTPEDQRSPDYNHLGAAQNNRPPEVPSSRALNLDIEQIALVHSRLALDMLLGPDSGLIGLAPEVNLCVFANRLVPDTFTRPLHCEFFHIARQSNCLDCGEVTGEIESEASRILASLTNSRRRMAAQLS